MYQSTIRKRRGKQTIIQSVLAQSQRMEVTMDFSLDYFYQASIHAVHNSRHITSRDRHHIPYNFQRGGSPLHEQSLFHRQNEPSCLVFAFLQCATTRTRGANEPSKLSGFVVCRHYVTQQTCKRKYRLIDAIDVFLFVMNAIHINLEKNIKFMPRNRSRFISRCLKSRKSQIQHCEQSELRLHFLVDKR